MSLLKNEISWNRQMKELKFPLRRSVKNLKFLKFDFASAKIKDYKPNYIKMRKKIRRMKL